MSRQRFASERLRATWIELLERHPGLGDVLFVCTQQDIEIV